MGPNTDDRELMKDLISNGMDVARFNFSHGDYEEHKKRLKLLKSVRKELGLPIATLLDTKGPEVRTGELKDNQKVMLTAGSAYILTTREVIGDSQIGHVNYSGFPEDVSVGNRILIDDGLIDLVVEEVKDTDVICKVINGGELGTKKGVNVPNVSIKLPPLTDKDKEDILFGIQEGFDFIAASFVRNAQCILEIKQILAEHHASMAVIAKIENAEGIKNLDEIIEASDGIMVARGDLGVEIPAEQVPYIQKTMIKKCNEACKPVITATQMLDSMIRNPRPTRAEVTDVANAVYDGTDAVMLSGETAMGKYPLESLKMMVQIVQSAEEHLDYQVYANRRLSANQKSVSNIVCQSSVSTARELGATTILAPSLSGFTTRMISQWRPEALIVGMSPSISSVRIMQLYWGVKPIQSKQADSTDELIEGAVALAKENGLVSSKDVTVVVAGVFETYHDATRGETNMMRVVTIR